MAPEKINSEAPNMATKTQARSCGGKRQHDTKEEALDHIFSLCRNAGIWPYSLTVYKCGYCKAWHVGHKPKKYQNRKGRR